MKFQLFERQPLVVNAVQLSEDNIESAMWYLTMNNYKSQMLFNKNTASSYIVGIDPSTRVSFTVRLTDWIIEEEVGFYSFSEDEVFQRRFRPELDGVLHKLKDKVTLLVRDLDEAQRRIEQLKKEGF
jgi:hypothetical protein